MNFMQAMNLSIVVSTIICVFLPSITHAATIDLCGDYITDVNISADDDVTMSCQVFIKDGATINIGPGTTIRALPETNPMEMKPATLVIERGAKVG